MSARFPARLHAVLASRAPVGVIFRRGPTHSVCSVLWDRTNDTFVLGQWMRARIYELRSDLSPDGRYLIYFARQARRSSETGGSWTAISRAPWLKAIVLLGKSDCWNGGGLFTSNNRYWLNGGCGHFVIRDSPEVRRDEDYQPTGSYGGECPSVYYRRLQRDGWVLKERLTAGWGSQLTVFEKQVKGWILRKYAHAEVGHRMGSGCYWDEHELEHTQLQRRIPLPSWQWAELDGETLVWAEDGCLRRSAVNGDGLEATRTLFDFNDMKFERCVAPY